MTTNTQQIVIWDKYVRLFHWSVATLFLLDFWVLEGGDPPHNWVGYAIGFLLIGRILWGFIGSHNARFSSFFPTPTRLRQHLAYMKAGKVDPHEGHNPVGALMIFFLLTLLSLIVLTGWMQRWDMFWGVEWVEETHEVLANIAMIAVVIHITAVVVMERKLGISLIRTMITGKRSL